MSARRYAREGWRPTTDKQAIIEALVASGMPREEAETLVLQ